MLIGRFCRPSSHEFFCPDVLEKTRVHLRFTLIFDHLQGREGIGPKALCPLSQYELCANDWVDSDPPSKIVCVCVCTCCAILCNSDLHQSIESKILCL